MGIKGWLTVGGVVLTGIAVWLGLKKKEDEHYEKIQKMIRDVDRKELEETTEKIIDDIEKSFRDMGLNDEADAYVDAMGALENTGTFAEERLKGVILENGENAKDWIDRNFEEMARKANQNADDVIKAGMQTLRKANELLNDSGANRQKEKELDEKVQKMKEDPEYAKQMAEKAEADYKRKVKKAVEQKNWSKLEDLFDGKYAGGPWHPSPASVFSEACSHGDISEEILKMAEEHFGKLWCYSGD